MSDSGEKNFTWTDEEVEKLLAVVNEYKTTKCGEGIEWESCKTRYEDVTSLFVEKYPKDNDEKEKFPRQPSDFTKERVQRKLKRIKLNFRKAVDAGRRSGGGRLVATFYEMCADIWSGCPAVESIGGGIDTSEDVVEIETETQDISRDDLENSKQDAENEEPETHLDDSGLTERRKLLQQKLKDKRSTKLSNRISTDNQMLSLAREKLQLKRKMMLQLEDAEKKHQKTMDGLLDGFTALTSVLNNGFGMMGNLIYPPYQPPNYMQQTSPQAAYQPRMTPTSRNTTSPNAFQDYDF